MRTGLYCCPVALAAATVGEKRDAIFGERRRQERNGSRVKQREQIYRYAHEFSVHRNTCTLGFPSRGRDYSKKA